MNRARVACALLLFLLVPSCRPASSSHRNHGITYLGKKDYDGAIRVFTEAIRSDPTDAHAYNNRGNAYMGKKDYDRAIQDYNQALRLNPTYAVAYRNRGIAHGGKKDFDRAIQDYNEAVRLNPTYSQAYTSRGDAYRSKKNYDRAIQDYKKAIQFDPNDAYGYGALAWLLATCQEETHRNGKQAVTYATRACELMDWNDAECLEILAAACAEDGQFQEAIKWQKKALEFPGLETEAREDIPRRLKLYEQRKPYREP
jgi:tetratricopeptide (TPR) repeat protein